LVATGSTPNIEFLQDSGLLEDKTLAVTPDLRTKDPNVFAIGDAVTIIDEETHTPWTWPQAVNQGKLAAANLYDQIPIPLNVMSRVNAMNLFGISLVVLGAPVAGAEILKHDNTQNGVYRELYIKNDRIVAGALVGDISGAGTLHAMMISGTDVSRNDAEIIAPHGKAFGERAWFDLDQYRSAVVIS
jgi:NAD(P)H-nitrite reductase large subunit